MTSLLATNAVAQTAWPTVRLPDRLARYPIGEQLTVNGTPMRLEGFVSDQPPALLLDALRQSMGEPLVETVSGNRHVLGRAQQNFYVTVQVEKDGSGSKGVVAVTDRLAAAESSVRADRPAGRAGAAGESRWIDRLPSGSVLTSDISANEGGKASRHRIIVNRHGEQRNREAVLQLMQEDGMRLEREAAPDAASRAALPPALAGATTLYFSGAGKEAVAVIVRGGERTSILLNTVNQLRSVP